MVNFRNCSFLHQLTCAMPICVFGVPEQLEFKQLVRQVYLPEKEASQAKMHDQSK